MPQKGNITESRCDHPLVSYLLITYNRKKDLEEAISSILNQSYEPIEIVIVDNNSSDGTQEMIQEKFRRRNIRYIRLPENRGVCGGRNVAIEAARGNILITLDDDAVIDHSNATAKVVSRLQKDPAVGVLAFKIVNYFTGKVDKAEFPTRNKKRSPDEEFEVATFIGAGHAVIRDVYAKVGLYRDYFPYGHEEFDLALRILDRGYKIIFFPEVVVRHKVRGTRREKIAGRWSVMLENRIKVAIRNLPWRYVLTTLLAWSLRTLIDCRGNILPIITAWRNLWRQLPKLKSERRPIKPETVELLRKHNRLYW